jgi:hypothetical protein
VTKLVAVNTTKCVVSDPVHLVEQATVRSASTWVTWRVLVDSAISWVRCSEVVVELAVE